MSETTSEAAVVIAEGWDETKCLAHIANLRVEQAQYEHTAKAMRAAAHEWDRQADWRQQQVAACIDTFTKPKAPTTEEDR